MGHNYKLIIDVYYSQFHPKNQSKHSLVIINIYHRPRGQRFESSPHPQMLLNKKNKFIRLPVIYVYIYILENTHHL